MKTKRTILPAVCGKCGATCSKRKYIELGWCRIQLFYADGNKLTRFTCKECRAKLNGADAVPEI
jgi:hypothetical protein